MASAKLRKTYVLKITSWYGNAWVVQFVWALVWWNEGHEFKPHFHENIFLLILDMGGIGNTTPKEAVPILPRQYGHFNLLGTLLKQIRSKLAINSLWTKTTLCTPRDWGGSAPVTLVTKLISIFSTQGTLNSFTFYKFTYEIIKISVQHPRRGIHAILTWYWYLTIGSFPILIYMYIKIPPPRNPHGIGRVSFLASLVSLTGLDCCRWIKSAGPINYLIYLLLTWKPPTDTTPPPEEVVRICPRQGPF